MSEDISTLVVRVTSDGIKDATKQLNDLAAASDKAEGSTKKLGTAAVVQADSEKKATDAIEKLLDKMGKQVDLIGANTAARNSYNIMIKKGTELQQEEAARLGALVDAQKQQEIQTRRDIEAFEAKGNSIKALSQEAIRNNSAVDNNTNSHRINSSAVREGAVLLHEATQGSWKRFGGSLIVLGERLDVLPKLFEGVAGAASTMGVSTGVLLGGITALVAAFGAAAYTFLHSQEQLKELRNTVILTGGAIGVTGDRLYEMADAAGSATGNISKAREAFVELGNTGKFTAEQIKGITEVALEMEHVTGTSVETVIKQFEKLAAEPLGNTEKSYNKVAKAAFELNTQLHYLTPEVFALISELDRQGKSAEATALSIKTLQTAEQERLEEAKKNLTVFGAFTADLFAGIKNGWTHLFEKGSNIEQLKDLQTELTRLDEKINRKRGTAGGFSAQLTADREKLATEIARIQSVIDAGDKSVKDKQKKAGEDLETIQSINLRNRLLQSAKGHESWAEVEKRFDADTIRDKQRANTALLEAQKSGDKDRIAAAEADLRLLSDQSISIQKEQLKKENDLKDKKGPAGTDQAQRDAELAELKQHQIEKDNVYKEGLQTSKAIAAADHTLGQQELVKREKLYDDEVKALADNYTEQYKIQQKFKNLSTTTPVQKVQATKAQQDELNAYIKAQGDITRAREKDEADVARVIQEDQDKILRGIETRGQAETKRAQDELNAALMQEASIGKLKSQTLDYDTRRVEDALTWLQVQEAGYTQIIDNVQLYSSAERQAANAALTHTKQQIILTKQLVDIKKKSADDQRKVEAQDRTTKNIDDALAAAKRFEKGMVDAFGNIGKAFGGISVAFAQYAKDQDTANVKFSKAAKDDESQLKAKKDLQEETANAQITGLGNVLDASKNFFNEQSRGYQAVDAISKVVHAAQLARNLAATVSGVIAGAAQMFGQSGWGGFAGVAAMGATLAALGYSITTASHSGGQSAADAQKAQGTGGVLGDSTAKSDSISKALDKIKDNADFTLPLTQQMAASLKNIENSIAGVAGFVARTTGLQQGTNLGIQTGVIERKSDPIIGGLLNSVAKNPLLNIALSGIFAPLTSIAAKISNLWGKTTQTIIDSGIRFEGQVKQLQQGTGFSQYASVNTTKSSFFGLSKSTTNQVVTQGLSDELNSQFGLIFSGLEKTLKIAAPSLGKDADAIASAIENFTLPLTQISLKDLKGDELTKAINNVISKALDDIAQAAFPELDAFRQVGEGYAETVVRVATGVEQATVALKEFNITAIDYTAIADKQADVALSIVQQSIALKEGASGVEAVIKGITSSATDVINAYRALIDLRSQLSSFGLGIGLSIDTITGAGGLDKLTKGLEVFADKFTTVGEKLSAETDSVTNAFAAIGQQLPASREQLRSWIEAAAKIGDQKQLGQLLNLTGVFDKLISDAESLGTGISDALGKNQESALALVKSLDVVNAAFNKLTTSVNQQKAAIESNYQAQSFALKEQHNGIVANIKANAAALDAQAAANKQDTVIRLGQLISANNAAKIANDAAIQATQDRVSGLNNILKSLSAAIVATSTVSPQDAYKNALDLVKTSSSSSNISGVAGLDDAIKTLQKPLEDSYSTFLDFQTAQATANDALTSLQTASDSQLTDAQKQLDALDATKDAIESNGQALQQAQQDLINDTVTGSQKALDAEDARYKAAQDSLDAQHTEDIAKLDEILRNAQDQLDVLNRSYTQTVSLTQAINGFNSSVAAATKAATTVAQAGGVSSNVPSSNTSFVEGLYNSLLGRTGETAGINFWNSQLAAGASKDQITSGFLNSDEYKSLHPSFAVGTNDVPEDMLANIHKGERIIPAADNAELMKRMKEGADSANSNTIAGKLDDLISKIMSGDISKVTKANELYRIIRDWDANGMPPTRP